MNKINLTLIKKIDYCLKNLKRNIFLFFSHIELAISNSISVFKLFNKMPKSLFA